MGSGLMTGKGIWENSRAPRPAAAVTGCCFRRRPPLHMDIIPIVMIELLMLGAVIVLMRVRW